MHPRAPPRRAWPGCRSCSRARCHSRARRGPSARHELGGDFDQHTAALREKLPVSAVRAVKGAEQVRGDHLLVDLHRDALEAPERADARVVHPDVDAAELVDRRLGEALDLVALADVRGTGNRVDAVVAAFVRELVKELAAPRRQYEPRTLASEFLRRAFAEAARGAGDDDDFSSNTCIRHGHSSVEKLHEAMLIPAGCRRRGSLYPKCRTAL